MGLFAATAAAREVVIVTSFPKAIFATDKKSFEAKHPGITLVINSKQTNAGGNMGRITERSFRVPKAVISGRFGIAAVSHSTMLCRPGDGSW